jgi:DNA (cytosine-5)-methyltransferase 1
MKLLSLCTGYGGLDIAVANVLPQAWMSGCAETDTYASKLLELEGAPHNYGDIRNIPADTEADIVTAGFPCQPISQAGLRKGKDDERWLWPHVFRTIDALRPGLAFLENVPALVRTGLDDVLRDLASIGFDAEWGIVSAAEVGAPHRRERIFILAWPAHAEGERRTRAGDTPEPSGEHGHAHGQGGAAAENTHSQPWFQRRQPAAGETQAGRPRTDAGGRDRMASGFHWPPQYFESILRWESATGRPAPDPVDERGRLSPPFAEWMMGLRPGHVTGRGFSRAQELKMIGNGVVPQQAAHALDLLLGRARL